MMRELIQAWEAPMQHAIKASFLNEEVPAALPDLADQIYLLGLGAFDLHCLVLHTARRSSINQSRDRAQGEGAGSEPHLKRAVSPCGGLRGR
jgi:hypothetical protein